MDDAEKKPDPEGLRIILAGRDPGSALYLGDNIDDALAAKAAGVPFMGILPKSGILTTGSARRSFASWARWRYWNARGPGSLAGVMSPGSPRAPG